MRSLAQWLALLVVGGGITALLYQRRPGFRRRIRLAVRVALLGYAALFIIRLIVRPPEEEQLVTLAVVVTTFALVWAGLWLLSERKSSRLR